LRIKRSFLIFPSPKISLITGERTEIEYSLQSYGIYVDQIPLTDSGNVKLQYLHQWIKVRKAIESQNDSTNYITTNAPCTGSIVECPGVTDVIVSFFGENFCTALALVTPYGAVCALTIGHLALFPQFRSGNKVYLFHPGNLLFRNLVEEKFEEHSNAQTQAEKVDITWWVINEILVRQNGRFLVWDKQAGWYTVLTNESRIREKVAVYIREFKKRVRAMGNRQEEESSTTKFEQQDGKRRRTNGDDVCCA
jgi:hypothetical protein